VIIGFSGYARSGKDTAGFILATQHRYELAAFADRLKMLALILSPEVGSAFINAGSWGEAKKEPFVREYLQMLGTAVRSSLGEDAWVHALFSGLDLARDYAITDVRFLSEARAVREAGGLIVRINRPGVKAVNDHISEHQMDDYDFDVIINNDGSVEDLKLKLEAMLSKEAN
jgi:hypothetical protein